MTPSLEQIEARLVDAGTVTEADVGALRRAIFPDGAVCVADAATLFRINAAVGAGLPAWRELFIEAMVVRLVDQASPSGYIDEADATWLIAQIDRDGRVCAATEFELLVRLIERAVVVPADLVDYALAQIVMVVLSGEDPTRPGVGVQANVIDAHEVRMLRRILMGQGSSGGLAISRVEAELVFDLADAVRDQANAPEWRRLFVQCISSYLMQATRRAAPTVDEARRREAWLRQGPSVGGFFGRMGRALLRGTGHQPAVDAGPGSAFEAKGIAEAEVITTGEAAWLIGRLGRDGVLSADEAALIEALAADAPDVAAAIERAMDAALAHAKVA